MTHPTLNEEKKLWKRGYKRVACLDEAGVGPLAGPVTAAAVTLDLRFKIKDLRWLREVNDSKKLSAKKREKLYKLITKNPDIRWGIGIVSEKIIDKINILEAAKMAMGKALRNLESKKAEDGPPKIDFLVLDGRMKINLPILQKSIVKADEKVMSCAMASILAKVTRDRLMLKYHKKYPKYRFDLHKGYGTKLHRKFLKKYGACPIHRKSFTLLRDKLK